MADLFGDAFTSFLNATPAEVVEAADAHGRLRFTGDSRTILAADAQDDVLFVGVLPPNATVRWVYMHLSATLGVGSTPDIGSQSRDGTVAADPNRFATLLDGTVAGITLADEPAAIDYTTILEELLTITFTGADPAADAVVNVGCFYIVD